ncbi:DgyrCDS12171 [Dimorphilus gyrociliatus]|uniref:Alpha-1,3-glucosyltransferase n=1 Tax=Dimorphilus gyrociliatus TaxID=2664684 RepID=A0A7I8W6I6_9ANNE|nr:DgyrCDS12171 [Dimorphilus gyrociliatus]
MGQIAQVLQRLFPFKRGLCHAYWAPNFWALYNFADKALSMIGKKTGYFHVTNDRAVMTGGLVQEFKHVVLPNISPFITLVCTLLAMIPILLKTLRRKSVADDFIKCTVLCSFISYMFGWHVHEKAVIIMILPLTLLSVKSKKDAKMYLLLSIIGHFSLFPLIFTPPENLIKYLMMALFTIISFYVLSRVHDEKPSNFLSTLEIFYLYGLIVLEPFIEASTEKACDGLIAEEIARPQHGYLYSQGYLTQEYYPNKALCRWAVSAEKDYEIVKFRLVNTTIRRSATCSEDYVEVKDGRTLWSRSIKRWCGEQLITDTVTSSGPKILVTFRTNNKYQDKGFIFEYWSEPKAITTYVKAEMTIVTYILFALFIITTSFIVISAIILYIITNKRKKILKKTFTGNVLPESKIERRSAMGNKDTNGYALSPNNETKVTPRMVKTEVDPCPKPATSAV